MTISEQIHSFADRFGKRITVNDAIWRSCHLGDGAPILWLTGGLRRAALCFALVERPAVRHAVIAPDYPPVGTMSAFSAAFDAILQAEGVNGPFAPVLDTVGTLAIQ